MRILVFVSFFVAVAVVSWASVKVEELIDKISKK